MSKEKKKILVVDDEKDIGDMIKEVLERTGDYEVTSTADALQACALCEKMGPDMVILDYVMPKMSGEEVIDRLKKSSQGKTPIILMSGLGEIIYHEPAHEWQWKPDNPMTAHRGDIHEIVDNIREPEDIAKRFGVTCFIFKPFNRMTFIKIIEKAFLKG